MKNKKILYISATVIVLVATLLVSIRYYDSYNASKASASSLSTNQQNSLDLINHYRKSKGLKELVWNDQLAQAAALKIEDEQVYNYFDHVSPEGKKAWDFISQSGYEYRFAGENLAIDFSDLNDAFDAWTKSPTHLENIISDKYDDFGFASREALINGKKTVLMVQMFGSELSIYDRILYK